MDTFANKFYIMGHETPWNAEPVGSTPASCDCVVEVRKALSNRGRNAGIFPELGGAVVSELSRRRLEEIASAADPRASAQPVPPATGAPEADSLERPDRGGILHRPVDVEEDRQDDREAFRGELPSGPCLVCDERRPEVELPKTRTPRIRAQRRSHRALEENHLAADKQKPR